MGKMIDPDLRDETPGTAATGPTSLRIGFVGTGRMGTHMVRRLLEAGYTPTVWNRTISRAMPLAALGARVVPDASAAAAASEILITMLQDSTAVEEVLFELGVTEAMGPGGTIIDMSSIPPAVAIDCARRLEPRGIAWLDAPVSGGTRGAEAGELTIMVGGESDAFARCAPVLESLGRATHVGPAGAGQTAKLANQIVVATTIGGVAEALLLVKVAKLDPEVVRTALEGGFADSRILREHGRRMVRREFEPGGAVELQLKDLHAAVAEAASLGLDLPLAEQVTELFQQLADSGQRDVDHSALILELERMNDQTPS